MEVENIEQSLERGRPIEIEFIRGGERKSTRATPLDRPPVQLPPREIRSLGIIVRDLTPFYLFQSGRTDLAGVWMESIRPGYPPAQARPPLFPGDIIIRFNNRPIGNTVDLLSLLRDSPSDAVLAFERGRQTRLTLLQNIESQAKSAGPVFAKRAWLGVTTQVLEKPLARKLGIGEEAALRITEVYPGTSAAMAGLKTGDVIVKVDGERPAVTRYDEESVFQESVRARRSGEAMALSLIRGKERLEVTVTLEAQPSTPNDMKRLEIPEIEATVREPTDMDRIEKDLPKGADGVVVEQVEPAGWADIGGLRAGDVLLKVAGERVRGIAELEAHIASLRKTSPQSFPVFVRRGPLNTLFLEIDWSQLP